MQYTGPSDYWNDYSLNPRERYYYGYYGTYGPWVDKSMYTSVGGGDSMNLSSSCNGVGSCEGFNGGCGCSGFGLKWVLFALVILYFLQTR